MIKKGTPQSLTQAIENGLEGQKLSKIQIEILRRHIEDYIAQKLGGTLLLGDFTENQCVLLKRLFQDHFKT